MKKIILPALLALVCMSCGGNNNNKQTAKANEVVSTTTVKKEASRDHSGTYKGTLPCADCEGINVELKLNKDNTYEMKTKYLGKDEKEVYTAKGMYTWNDKGDKITITDNNNEVQQYLVGDKTLMMLDGNGNVIEGELAPMYILTK